MNVLLNVLAEVGCVELMLKNNYIYDNILIIQYTLTPLVGMMWKIGT